MRPQLVEEQKTLSVQIHVAISSSHVSIYEWHSGVSLTYSIYCRHLSKFGTRSVFMSVYSLSSQGSTVFRVFITEEYVLGRSLDSAI